MQTGTDRRKAPKVPDGLHYRYVDLVDGDAVHVFTPEGEHERAAVLWIHGGGMVIGSAAQDYARCMEVARDLDVVVVSVEYRLAPAHPYPAAMDDCFAAWEWTRDHASELGVDAGRMAIGGESAGGGLAAGLVQRIHDAGGTQPVAQWLFCPMLDDRTSADRSQDGVRHFVWNNTSNRVGWTAYLGTAPGGTDVPDYASPARRLDLAGLPPAWVGTGDIELFFDENRSYAERLRAAGVPCVLDVVPGGPHAFEALAGHTEVARAYWQRSEAWLRERLASG
ncbi:MAG: alpha/beta hydrolase [Actinobacteria bacterium]|nr:alpha/beta hydrolase [Actinomycetota bacterium]